MSWWQPPVDLGTDVRTGGRLAAEAGPDSLPSSTGGSTSERSRSTVGGGSILWRRGGERDQGGHACRGVDVGRNHGGESRQPRSTRGGPRREDGGASGDICPRVSGDTNSPPVPARHVSAVGAAAPEADAADPSPREAAVGREERDRGNHHDEDDDGSRHDRGGHERNSGNGETEYRDVYGAAGKTHLQPGRRNRAADRLRKDGVVSLLRPPCEFC